MLYKTASFHKEHMLKTKMVKYVYSLILVVCVTAMHGSAHWTYDMKSTIGPRHWQNIPGFEACGRKKQSPINLPTEEKMELCVIEEFEFEGFDDPSTYKLTLKNNGHSIQLDIEGNVYISKGGLKGKYQVAQLHFHWGPVSDWGSEHQYNGKQSPMEMHIVTWSKAYPNIGTAMKQKDGLAVLSVLIEKGEEDNCVFAEIVGMLEDVRHKGQKKSVPHNWPLREMLPKQTDFFYRYSGSLTTPPCFESVIWTVFSHRITLSEEQIDDFRKVYQDANGDKLLEMNFRNTQALNSRKVLKNFHGTKITTEPASTHCPVIIFS